MDIKRICLDTCASRPLQSIPLITVLNAVILGITRPAPIMTRLALPVLLREEIGIMFMLIVGIAEEAPIGVARQAVARSDEGR